MEQKIWKPIESSKGGPKNSYLAFANDFLCFAGTNLEQVDAIKEILDIFCTSSGKKVNVDKTRILFSNNLHWNIRDDIVHKLDFLRMTYFGKYLGVPLHHDRVSKQNHQFIIDKVNQRLSNWKTSNLSIACRVTLTKVVIQAMHIYVIQTTLLLSSVCEEIEKNVVILFGATQIPLAKFIGEIEILYAFQKEMATLV